MIILTEKCKYSPRLICCIHTVHLRRHLRGTLDIYNIQDSQKSINKFKQNTDLKRKGMKHKMS